MKKFLKTNKKQVSFLKSSSAESSKIIDRMRTSIFFSKSFNKMADFERLFDSSQSFVTSAVNHIPPVHNCLRANGEVVVGVGIGARFRMDKNS